MSARRLATALVQRWCSGELAGVRRGGDALATAVETWSGNGEAHAAPSAPAAPRCARAWRLAHQGASSLSAGAARWLHQDAAEPQEQPQEHHAGCSHHDHSRCNHHDHHHHAHSPQPGSHDPQHQHQHQHQHHRHDAASTQQQHPASTQHPQHRHSHPPRRAVSLEDVEKACWSCDKLVRRGGLVCQGCETVQKPDESLNYFELFSLPSGKFDVAPGVLEKRYRSLQWGLHPDKVTRRPAAEREYSAQAASLINLAYAILKSPLSRANYILMLRGISAGDSHEGTIDDPELLMQVMEAREEVENTDDPAALAALLAANRTQQEALVAQLSAAFARNDMAVAVDLTNRLQYVAKLEQEIVKKLPHLPAA